MLKFYLFILLAALANPITSTAINKRIYKGEISYRHQFPYFVFIESVIPIAGCGGTLISNQWIMTAATCVRNIGVGKAFLGAWYYVNFVPTLGQISQLIHPELFHIHPEFKWDRLRNNIALIKLSVPVEFSDIIQPAKLLTSCEDIEENLDVLTMGFGGDDYDVIFDSVLSWLLLQTTSPDVCKKALNQTQIFDDSVFCAQFNNEHSQGVCTADIGGPIVRQNDSVVIGLSTYTNRESKERSCNSKPIEFTHIVPHFKWLSEVTGLKFPHC